MQMAVTLQNHSEVFKFPMFSLCFSKIFKFPVFSLSGITFHNFPCFPCAVGTLHPIDLPDVIVLGYVERKGEKSDRGKDTPVEKKKSSHRSLKKTTKASKSTDFKDNLKSLDGRWLEDLPG